MFLDAAQEGLVSVEINQQAKIRLASHMSQTICKCQQRSVTVGNDQKYCRQSDYYWQMSSWSLKPVHEREERQEIHSSWLKQRFSPELFKGQMKTLS